MRRLGALTEKVRSRLEDLAADDVVARIWKRDHTVWRPDPTEIADRLGWLDAPERATAELPALRALADRVVADGLTHAVVLGMGGSSLAPEVLRGILGVAPGMLDLTVLDTTHPDSVVALEERLPLDRTLFVVSSKSGSTVETRSHLEHFWSRLGNGRQFLAITDPGSPLQVRATELGFREVLHAPADVGGRYSALTAFGLVPAALIGAELDALVGSAVEEAAACGPDVPAHENPAAVLGAAMGVAALAGRDKCTLDIPGGASPFGAWVEQLLAESTGKEQRAGIVPVDLDPSPTDPGDRLFIGTGDVPEPGVSLGDELDLGSAFFRLELATAVAGQILEVNPFDQPDVQEAKDRTAEALAGNAEPAEPPEDLDLLLESAAPGDYVAILAFANPTEERVAALQAARARIGAATGVATTLGIGPRYLHSTGQLHKGGPPNGIFVQVVEDPSTDVPIPGAPYTFGDLIRAQADGDLAALRARARRVARVPLEDLLSWEGRTG